MTTDPMTEIRASFFVECEDLLENLQDALNLMDAGEADGETVNVVFRAVHSIKGGAGAFGLHALVGFAHRFETVLDELRAGRLDATADAVRLFFQAADRLQDHVRAARDEGPPPAEAEEVLTRLEDLMGGVPVEAEAEIDFIPTSFAFDLAALAPAADDASPATDVADDGGSARADAASSRRGWHIRFAPREGLYRSGNEAALVLRGLGELGPVTMGCEVPADLSLTEDEAERPRLAWTIDLLGDVDRAEIEEVFDFVADVCDIAISASDLPAVPVRVPVSEAPAPATAPVDPAETPQPAAPVDTSLEASEAAPVAASRPGVSARSPDASGGGDGGSATVRVDLERIDRLVNLVGELVINQAMLSQSVAQAGLADTEVTAGLEAFMTLTRDIQEGVMSVRAQPVKPLFQRMARIVREASASVGKSVRLKTEGENTEVDKTVIERLADPLTHMIRNAVDHGLEASAGRIAAAKPEEGQITLSAFHRGGRIVIEVADDGAGINRPRVRDIAVAKGLIAADAQLTDAEIDNLLFLPGFSTAEKVSALSGRGVGMDVVRSSIAALGGRIAIASDPGRGTTFSVSLPLTLAVLDGMVVGAAGQTFVVPLSAIIETAGLVPEAVRQVGAQSELLHMRGDLIPIVDLGARLGFRSPQQMNRNGIVLLTSQDNGERTALVVDTIMEQRQVVIKGLGSLLPPMPGVAAATILGDGQIALILDPADLVQKTRPSASPPDLALAG